VEELIFSVLNVHRSSDVRQREIHTAEPLVPDPRPFSFQIAIAKSKSFKSPSSDKISSELIKQEVKYYALISIS
jgi:hypothetical protein